ncbi:hypothetical protein FRC07_002921 [Ceratobasidium sp. 392]|nr:hypothetical protein FRC07_002921 [Ceratobasidium sp. 392]
MGSILSNFSILPKSPAMREPLDSVSLRAFLDVYPGPAFILCPDGSSQNDPPLVYGNLALHSLVLGEENPAALDHDTFFGAVGDTSVFQGLGDATYPATNMLSKGSWNIDIRPPWLTHEHEPLRLEFTVTPIQPVDRSANRLFVYTALPARTLNALLSPRATGAVTQEQDSVPERPLSRLSDSSVISNHSLVASNAADLPSSLLHKFPWETTSLGPQAEWPESLKTMVRYITATTIPTTIYWGWPDLVMIYNDAYATLVGSKHPSIYGQKASVAWGDQWDRASSIAELCKHGQSTRRTDESDTHDEVLQVVLKVLSEYSTDFPFAALYLCSSNNARARPYLRDADSRIPRISAALKPLNTTLNLAGVVGIPDNHPVAPQSVQYTLNPTTLQPRRRGARLIPMLERDIPTRTSSASGSYPSRPSTASIEDKSTDSPWPFHALFSSGAIEIVSSLPESLTEGLPKRSFGDRPNSAALIPIPIDYPGNGPNLPHAILVVGLNTHLTYDESYAKWLESIAAAFTSRLIVVLQMEVDAELARERARLDAAQSKFFMGVSHELRTPLTLIQAPLEQLADSKMLSPGAQDTLDLATRNVRRLRRIVESILDVSKLEAGQITRRFRPVRLDRITVEMASLFRGIAEGRGIKLHLEIDDEDVDERPYTYIDVQLWEKIFYNLLSNAFKYTKTGTVTISVAYDLTSAFLHVRDTGIGIPEAKQEEIFGLFRRLNDLPAEGSGIGLAIAKELVNLHGGKLSVSSRAESEYVENTGSMFTVEIPLGCDHLAPELVDDERVVSPSDLIFETAKYWMELDIKSPVLGTNEKMDVSALAYFKQTDAVLVVDNDADMRSFLRSIFTPYMTVFEARDGQEALEVLQSNDVNLILRHVPRDILMPRINGPELVTKLRSETKTMFIPVIFVTAVTDNIKFLVGQTEGIVDCVTKPFKVRDLLARSHLQLQLGKRRIKLENNFTERSSELQALTNLSPVGIFRTNTIGCLTYANPKWYHITGFSADRDKDEWLEHVHSESQPDALQAWHECFVDGKSASIQVQWVGGTWTQFDIAPLLTPGGDCLGAIGTITDITDLHRLEQSRLALAEERERAAAIRADDAEKQRQAEVERRKAQELLIDVTSHELRQPVSAILQNAEVVRANMKVLRGALAQCSANDPYVPTAQVFGELDDDIQALNNITQCAISQERIANDILSLSKIQLNALTILPIAFELKSEVQQILTGFGTELASKGISLSVEFGSGVNTPGFSTVFTDLGRLTQIITNLMSNAIRFTEMNARLSQIKVSLDISSDPPLDGSCQVPSVATQPAASGKQPQSIYIFMAFRDSGPGLPPEDLALLFQQGSNDHHIFGGSGLDLFWGKFLDLLGGRVEVQNSTDGATLRFFIRATKSPPPALVRQISAGPTIPGASSPTEPSSPASKRNLRVLVTEDNKVNQTILMRQMKRVGFTAVLASNGAEAVRAVTQALSNDLPFDAILMDLQMPVMQVETTDLDGFAAAKEIRRLENAGSLKGRNFIIAVTGNARAEQIQHARDSGVDDVLIKVRISSTYDLLSSMFYGEGELEMDDEAAETIVTLRDFLDSPSLSKPLSLVLTTILHLRAPVSASTHKLPPLLELSIKHSSWLSRTKYEELLASLPAYTGSLAPSVQGAEDARDWLMQTIEHLQSESTVAKLAKPFPSTVLSTPETAPGISLVTRAWFYLPSLSTRSKRADIVNLAPQHSITGFVLAGKPGLLCLESLNPLGPDTFIARIKTESWADIPSHQKKITERYRESGVQRAFESMDEVTEMISTRGARANRGDMGEVRVFLEEKGLKGVLEIVLGANEFK